MTTTATPATTMTNEEIHTLNIRKEIVIDAPIAMCFEAVLAEIGPGSQLPDGKPYPMKVEPWPGGRWFRDLGEKDGYAYGHLWGYVQVIKAPTLLELRGPMPMSYPGENFLQYRLTEEGSKTRLTLTHRAMGLIPPEQREGWSDGWDHGLGRVKLVAEQKAASKKR
ncbi:MAG TPA: SRPBCC domain-containing protein [Phycisphaerales bacterium]|nr:SRPBCC domain-containing protein [Phycisphaerales bacterium]